MQKSMLKISNYLSLFIVILTVTYFFVRIFFSLDFTDEMQYYGQIQGLLSSNKLFVNDFFIQQTGYILIYPFLKVIQFFEPQFEFINLIFYTRILLFLIIICTFLLLFYLSSGYRLFSRIIGSCFVSISITQFSPFAFSYNSLGFLLTSLIFSFWLFSDSQYKIIILSTLVLFLGWIYPPQGILFSLIIVVDFLILKKLNDSIKFIIYLTFLSLIFVLFMLGTNFFSINSFIESLYFTQNYPYGFRDISFFLIIFSSLIVILSFCFFIIFLHEPKFILFLRKKFNWLFYIISSLFVCAGFYMIFNKYFWIFSVLFWFASICVMMLQNLIDQKNKIILIKILLSSVLISLTYGFTSGNSFGVLYRGFFVCIGFLFLVFSSSIESEKIYKQFYIDILGVIIFLGLIINIFGKPYRDAYIFDTLYKTKEVHAYNNIFISKIKLDAIEEIKKNISIKKNKTLLVLGPHPWIYFALNAKPNTPYLFMHFLIGNHVRTSKVEKFVIDKIRLSQPDYIIDVIPESSAFFKNNIDIIIKNYSCKEFVVDNKMNNLLEKEIDFRLPPRIKVCSK